MHEHFTPDQPRTAQEIASVLDSGNNKRVFDVVQEMRDLYIKNPEQYRNLAKEVDKLDQKGAGGTLIRLRGQLELFELQHVSASQLT